MKIAICGTRGIPACYGGFETFAEELSTRLVKRGHSVTVYGRTHVIDYQEPQFCGVDLKLLSAPQHKYLETPVHSLKSLIDVAWSRDFDVVLLCNAANSPFAWIPRIFGTPVAINLDGIERHRSKWNAVGKLWYLFGEICSVLFASKMISDAVVIRDYYRRCYGRSSEVLSYGFRESSFNLAERKAEGKTLAIAEMPEKTVFSEFSLEPDNYILYVSRFEPENNARLVVDAYNELPERLKEMPLVIVGDAPYACEYIASVKAAAGPNVKFLGYQFGEAYEALALGAFIYIQATEVGGTHPALVESLGFANCVVANDVPEHREVLYTAGIYYQKNSASDLTAILEELLLDRKQVYERRKQCFERARDCYSWDKISKDYEQLFDIMTS